MNSPTPVITACAWACVRDRRLLVVRSAGSDAFYLPGGKPEPGETPAETAAREVLEETGVSIPADRLRLFSEVLAPAHGRPGTDVRLVCFVGPGDFPGPDDEPVASAEIEEIGWFTSADSDRCAPAIQIVVAQLVAAGLID